jgi:hypothetical protein
MESWFLTYLAIDFKPHPCNNEGQQNLNEVGYVNFCLMITSLQEAVAMGILQNSRDFQKDIRAIKID